MDPIVRVETACRLLDCTKPTIYRMIKRGDLPQPIHVNNRFVYWTSTAFELAVKRLHKKYQ